MIRTFIAVDLPDPIINKVSGIIEYFRTQTPPDLLKWVDPTNIHLTVKFLGEIPKKNLDSICAILSETMRNMSAFNLTIRGLGMYPNAQKPRVIWLGVHGIEPLLKMHTALDQNLLVASISPEKRKYSPHLTLARVRRQAEDAKVHAAGKTLSQFKVDSLGEFTIDTVRLYQSDLTPKGSLYTPLLTVPLNKV